MKRTKALSLAVSVIFLLSIVLTACSSKSATSPSPSAAATQAPASTATSTASSSATPDVSSLAPYQIVMYYPANDTNPKAAPQVEAAINAILKDKINATIKLVQVDWNDYDSKTSLIITSNQKIDVLLSASWNNYNQHVSQGYYMPMNDLLAKYGQGITQTLPNVYLPNMKINGETYGIPTNKEYASNVVAMLAKPLVEKYSIDINSIKQFTDLEPALATVHKGDPTVEGLQMDQNGWYLLNGYFEQVGSDPFGSLDRSTTEMKIVDEWSNPQIMTQLRALHKWYLAGYLRKDAATQQGATDWKTGKVFAGIDVGKPHMDVDFSAVSAPIDQLMVQIAPPYSATSDLTGVMLSIAKNAQDPARDMMFLNLLMTNADLVNLMGWGIEGVNYTKVNDTQVTPIADSGWEQDIQWQFGNEFLSYVSDKSVATQWADYKAFNDSAVISRIIGFNFDPTPVQTQEAALNTIMNQYKWGLMTGTLDPDKAVPEMLKKFKAAGYDTVIAEKQKQLDAFLAAKGSN